MTEPQIGIVYNTYFLTEKGRVFRHEFMINNRKRKVYDYTKIASDVESFDGGYNHITFKTKDGKFKGIGIPNNRQLEEIILLNELGIDEIALGKDFAIIRDKNNMAYGIGYNKYGQLGLGDKIRRLTPTKIEQFDGTPTKIKEYIVGLNNLYVITTEDKLYGSGLGSSGQLLNEFDLDELTYITDNVQKVVAGYNYILILKKDGNLYGLGDNRYGQLGVGDTKNKTALTLAKNNVTDVFCGPYTSFCVSGSCLYATGLNNYGQLGLGNNVNRNTFTKISKFDNHNITKVSAALNKTVVLIGQNTVYFAGDDTYNDVPWNTHDIKDMSYFRLLAYDDNSSWDKAFRANITDIYLTKHGIFFLDKFNNLYFHGNNLLNMEKINMALIKENVKKVSVSANNHMMLIDIHDHVYCAGINEHGELGMTVFVGLLNYEVMEWTAANAVSIYAGDNFSYYVDKDGIPYGTGLDTYTITKDEMETIHQDTWEWHKSIIVEKLLYDLSKTRTPKIDKIATGYNFSLFLSRGQLFACGYNQRYQIGVSDTNDHVDIIKIMDNVKDFSCGKMHTLILDKNNNVYGMGCDYDCQLGIDDRFKQSFTLQKITGLSNMISVSAGYSHSVALNNNKARYIFGDNQYGQISNSSKIVYEVPTSDTNEVRDIGPTFIAAKACYHYTLYLNSNNELYILGEFFEDIMNSIYDINMDLIDSEDPVKSIYEHQYENNNSLYLFLQADYISPYK